MMHQGNLADHAQITRRHGVRGRRNEHALRLELRKETQPEPHHGTAVVIRRKRQDSVLSCQTLPPTTEEAAPTA